MMNLHEQCLLRYLKLPDELSYATEVLKLNNKILEQKFIVKNILANISVLNYTENVKQQGFLGYVEKVFIYFMDFYFCGIVIFQCKKWKFFLVYCLNGKSNF